MLNLFGNNLIENHVSVNIYADEIQLVKCPYTDNKWFYIGLVVENVLNPLLDDIVYERYRGNFERNSPYYQKNDRVIHWSEINDIDTKNIAKRWIEYILNPDKSKDNFYAYVLGINYSSLDSKYFDPLNEFNSMYNRFFRSAVLYALKCFFPKKKVEVLNIFHEEGQQKEHRYFPWHAIYTIQQRGEDINFKTNEIFFLPKSHRSDKKSNLIQLCDLFLGLCKSMLHGIKLNAQTSKYKKELLDLFLPLFERMINEPNNKNSKYAHAYRIMIRFFSQKQISLKESIFIPKFDTTRNIKYKEDISNQLGFNFC